MHTWKPIQSRDPFRARAFFGGEHAVPVFAATLPLALLQFVLLGSAPRARDVAIYREERTAHAEDCAASCDAKLRRIIELQEKLATSLADCAFWRLLALVAGGCLVVLTFLVLAYLVVRCCCCCGPREREATIDARKAPTLVWDGSVLKRGHGKGAHGVFS